MREVTLPSGATAVLRDADDIAFGDSDDALRAMNIQTDGDGNVTTPMGGMLGELQRAVVVLGVDSWTAVDLHTGEPLPLPMQDPTAIRRLSARDGRFLVKELWSLRDELVPDFSVDGAVKLDPATGQLVNDENSPTSPSAGSATG